jgi:hypothetical protein
VTTERLNGVHFANIITFDRDQAILEGSTGTKWSSDDDWVDIDYSIDTDVEEADDTTDDEGPADEDFEVDQAILDDLDVPIIPETQAGQASGEELQRMASANVKITKAGQDKVKGALWKVSHV